jgi:hypothetical protein
MLFTRTQDSDVKNTTNALWHSQHTVLTISDLTDLCFHVKYSDTKRRLFAGSVQLVFNLHRKFCNFSSPNKQRHVTVEKTMNKLLHPMTEKVTNYLSASYFHGETGVSHSSSKLDA